MKIIISENQYKKVFDNDFLIVSEQKIIMDGWTKSGSAPEKINYGVNELNTYTACRPRGEIVAGIPGYTDWDWCKAKKLGDPYMGAVTYEYNGKKVTIKDFNSRAEDDGTYSYGLSSLDSRFINPTSEKNIINNAIRTYNSVNSSWNRLKKIGNWDGEVYNLVKFSNSKSKLEEAFNNPYSDGIGIGNTNLLWPGDLIKEYFKLKSVVEDDILSVLSQERFKKEQIELGERYKLSLKRWKEDYKKWEQRFGEQYNKIQNSIKNTINSKNIAFSIEDYRNNLWRDQDSNEPSKYRPNYVNNLLTNNTYQSDLENDPKPVDWDSLLKELESQIGEIKLPRKLTKKESIQKFQNWLDKNYPTQWTTTGKPLNKKTPGYGTFEPQTTKAWKKYGPVYYYELNGKIKPPPPKPKEPEIRELAQRQMGEKSNLEQVVETYLHIIQASANHNERFESQSASKYKEYCDRPVATSRKPREYDDDRGNLNSHYKHTFNYVCDTKKLGGVWWYSGGKNLGSCGCVNNPTTPVVFDKVWRYNMSEIVEYGATQNDIRSLWEKTVDWADKCVGDWHCVADIASIAVLFIPVPGLNVALSAAIDGISAAGYVIEGDEGWELNAGLTLVGALFSGAEALKFTNRALKGGLKNVKWTKALGEMTTELNNKAFKNTLEGMTKSEAADVWSKKLRDLVSEYSSKEIKQLTDVIDSFQKMDKLIINDLEKIMKNMVNLTPKEKEILQLLTKQGVKESKLIKFAKEVKNADFDIKKVLSNYIPKFSTKDALIQASLFSGIQVFGEDIGEGLREFSDTIKRFTGQKIDPTRILSQIDSNPNDPSSIALKKALTDSFAYHFLSNMIDIETRLGMGNLLSKYNIKVDKDIRDIVFNGMESITGKEILEKTQSWLKEIWDNEKKMVKENKSEEEIKKYIVDNYMEIVDLLEKAPEEDKLLYLFDNLEKEEKKNEKLNPADYENLLIYFPELF